MSGKLYLLTPISSPMVTQPTSPTASDAAAAAAFMPDASAVACGEPTAGAIATSGPACGAKMSSCHRPSPSRPLHSSMNDKSILSQFQHQTDMLYQESPFSAACTQATPPSSPSPSPRSCNSNQYSSSFPQQQRWRSPPCCSSCGAAKADAGTCSGCGSRFCRACMQPESAAGVAKAGKSGLGGPCGNCSSLCNNCKPIACSFCEPGDEQQQPARMCEACAGTCDSCKRAACDACASAFVACSSCGYATCEECQLQSQMGGDMEMGANAAGAAGGCWCAPPLRSANNVRHISSQRYQMSQLHPSVLGATMEAAGLRDADFDEYDTYEDTDGQYDSMSNVSADFQQQLDADVLEVHHKHWAAAEGLAGLDSKTLGAVLGSIGYGISPGSSSGSYQGSSLAATAAGGVGGYYHHQQAQHLHRGGLVLGSSGR